MNTKKVLHSNHHGVIRWSEDDTDKLLILFQEGKQLVQEELEVALSYELGKPELNTEDPIEEMLERECYRFAFEEENVSYKEMKENQKRYREKVEAFIRQNVLFHAFITIERHKTLCDDYEMFKRYPDFNSVLSRFHEIQVKLEEKGVHFWENVLPSELSYTFNSVG